MSQQYFGLAILFTINTINFLDRLSIAAVLTNIKDFYGLSALQSGLLSTCFLVGYMLTAPIFGYLGDKYSRKWIVIGGILFWILAAFSGSLIGRDHYLLFFVARMLVGVGEASYSTIAPTIIADLFEPKRRKLFLSIFYFAVPIGSGLGFLTGTLALQLGDWRWIFRITPAIGLVATFFLLFFKEPIRGQTDGGHVILEDSSSIREDIRYLCQIPSYIWATIGFTCCLFAQGALSWWAINFMGQACGEEYEKDATTIFGAIIFAAGFVGVTVGSSSAQYLKKFDGRADPLVCSVGIFAAVPLTFFGLVFARSITGLSWVLLFLAVTALSTNWAVISDMILSITVPNKRAFATAIQILISHLFGDATSPFIVGFIRDELHPILGDEYRAFLYALLSTLIILTLGAFAFLYCCKFFVEDVEKCKSSIGRKDEIDEGNITFSSNLTDFATLP